MFPLQPDPAASLPPAVWGAFTEALAAPGPLRVPGLVGVPAAVVVRWLYRRWLATVEEWRPLVQVAAPLALLPRDALAELIARAEGGWLHFSAVDVPTVSPLAGADVRLVVAGPRELPLPDGLARQLLELDGLHLVATDPGLAGVRRSLSAHARAGASVLLTGPAGAGKASLVRLAWQERGDGAPFDDAANQPPTPDAWALYREAARLDEHDLAALRRRLRPEAPPRTWRPGPAALRPADPAFSEILGESPALCRVLSDAARLARSSAPVLLLGEPGVGKEVFARAIHRVSGRRGPFEAVDLSAIPRDLVESELFGHVRGAFTGANAERPGAFRRAEGGTLLLDELGNLDVGVQAKLLRVLQERIVRPVGAEKGVAVDVRIIGATHANLEAMVARGTFRLDLLHRLNALILAIPPLRERPEDILLLARRFLQAARGDSDSVHLAPAAAELLLAWPWPGNVRELWGVMERAAAFSERGRPLEPQHLDRLTIRRGPTFVTSEGPCDLPVAVRLAVPSLGARGASSIRHAVGCFARERVVRADALRALEAQEWDAELTGLRADMEALLDAVEGPIDRAAVARVLPHRLPSSDRSVLVRFLQQGQGLDHSFPDGVVVLGRARGWDDLYSGPEDRRGAARVAGVRALLGAGEPAFLSIPTEAALSRVQVAIRRQGSGLEVGLLPDASAPTTVRRPGGQPEALVAGQLTRCGEAVELAVQLDREGLRRLRVGVYAGTEARARHAAALDDPDADRLAVQAETGRVPTEAAEPTEAPMARVWALEPEERALLNTIVLHFREGDFSAHLRRSLLARAGEPAAARLQGYLLRVRPTQYCARLYEFPENGPLVRELALALGERDRATWLSALPGQLSTVLGARLG
jgi:DNA-binding NtrC family response regulator